MHTVSFPNLGLEFNIDPVVFSIGNFSLNWYGLLIGIGILLAMWMGFTNCRRFGIVGDKLFDVVMVGIIGAIIGARLYYVAFRWDSYKDNLIDIFKTWEGGLAIYGGIIGGLGVGAIMAKIRKVKILPALDLAGLGYLIGQGIGRWGNFVNGEAFGSNTDLPWGMTGDRIVSYLISSSHVTGTVDASGLVHPCFLYESIWCLAGFALLFWYSKRRRFDGELFLMYLGWYGLGRVFIEGLRTDSLMLGNLRVSQLLAGILVVVSAALWIAVRSKIRAANDPEYLKLYGETEAFTEEYETYMQALKEKEAAKKAKKNGVVEEPAEEPVPEDEEEPVDVVTVSDEDDEPAEEPAEKEE